MNVHIYLSDDEAARLQLFLQQYYHKPRATLPGLLTHAARQIASIQAQKNNRRYRFRGNVRRFSGAPITGSADTRDRK